MEDSMNYYTDSYVDKVVDAIAAVRAIHSPIEIRVPRKPQESMTVCKECMLDRWSNTPAKYPCKTIIAIDKK
jgi:hypothetical protein